MRTILLLACHMSDSDYRTVVGGLVPSELESVASRLNEALAFEKAPVVTTKCAEGPLAERYAAFLLARISVPYYPHHSAAETPEESLTPDKTAPKASAEELDDFVTKTAGLLREAPADDRGSAAAILIVDNRPQLERFGTQILSNRRKWKYLKDGPAPPISLEPGEVVALELDSKKKTSGHLLWTVDHDDQAEMIVLREKIKSKIDIAKVWGGFITLVLGGVLLSRDELTALGADGHRHLVYVAAVAFFVAVVLYIQALYAYDALLMPERFWSQRARDQARARSLVSRPPSSSAWILYQKMIHIWLYLFTPATIFVAFGFVVLAYVALELSVVESLVGFLVLVSTAVYISWSRNFLERNS
jgi:hypothetical protein